MGRAPLPGDTPPRAPLLAPSLSIQIALAIPWELRSSDFTSRPLSLKGFPATCDLGLHNLGRLTPVFLIWKWEHRDTYPSRAV